jgi:hypothetical protein
MFKPKPPCNGCIKPKRSSTCHSVCEAYISYRKKADEYREWEYQQRQLDYMIRNTQTKHSRRYKRNKNFAR